MYFKCETHGGLQRTAQISKAASIDLDHFDTSTKLYRYACIIPNGNSWKDVFLDGNDHIFAQNYLSQRDANNVEFIVQELKRRGAPFLTDRVFCDADKRTTTMYDRKFINANMFRLAPACPECLSSAYGGLFH